MRPAEKHNMSYQTPIFPLLPRRRLSISLQLSIMWNTSRDKALWSCGSDGRTSSAAARETHTQIRPHTHTHTHSRRKYFQKKLVLPSLFTQNTHSNRLICRKPCSEQLHLQLNMQMWTIQCHGCRNVAVVQELHLRPVSATVAPVEFNWRTHWRPHLSQGVHLNEFTDACCNSILKSKLSNILIEIEQWFTFDAPHGHR